MDNTKYLADIINGLWKMIMLYTVMKNPGFDVAVVPKQ